jgi:hypothetical protein
MSNPPGGLPPHPARSLESWKEVAHFLGVTIRTAQIWEKEHGLPVKRLPGPRGRIRVSVPELELWLASNHVGPSDSSNRKGVSRIVPFFIIAVLTLIGATGVFVSNRDPGEMAWSDQRGSVLSAYDIEGRTLWSHDFGYSPEPASSEKRSPSFNTPLWDINGDGKAELLFVLDRDGGTKFSSEVYCFDNRGRVLWTFRPGGRKLRTARHFFRDVYFLRWLLRMPDPGGNGLILLAGSNETPDYPMEVAAIDSKGRVLRKYYHSGHIPAACTSDLERDGRVELYLVGIAQGERRVDITVLDPLNFGGASRERNRDYQLLDLGHPVEIARILLFRSSLGEDSDMLYGTPVGAICDDWMVRATVEERPRGRGSATLEFKFGPRVTPLGIEPSDSALAWFRDMTGRGRLPKNALDTERARMNASTVVTPWRRPIARD